MDKSQMWTIIGTLGTLIVIGISWLHTLFSKEFEHIRKEISTGFERQELLLKLHEAIHHQNEEK